MFGTSAATERLEWSALFRSNGNAIVPWDHNDNPKLCCMRSSAAICLPLLPTRTPDNAVDFMFWRLYRTRRRERITNS